MNLQEFEQSLKQVSAPSEISESALALWWDAKGEWEQAHRIAQDINNATGAWIHAYLHRKEGDLGNAGYWYSRAGRPVCQDSLEEEWRVLVESIL